MAVATDGKHLPPLRRIVAGHNARGLGSVLDDTAVHGAVDGHLPGCNGLASGALWSTDCVPSKDTNNCTDGAERHIDGHGLVMRNGTNFRFTDLAPGASSPMHRTSSVDYNILILGKLILVNGDGTETCIENPGDTVVLKGSLHAWRNPGPGWTRWASVLVDAEAAVVDGKTLEDVWNSDV